MRDPVGGAEGDGDIAAADIGTADDRAFVHQFSAGLHARMVRYRNAMTFASRLGKMRASARAAVGGLDSAERESLARTEVADAVKGLPLNPSLTTVRIAEDGGRLRIVVTYDASRHPLMLLGGMIPRPPAVIERSAVVRVGEE